MISNTVSQNFPLTTLHSFEAQIVSVVSLKGARQPSLKNLLILFVFIPSKWYSSFIVVGSALGGALLSPQVIDDANPGSEISPTYETYVYRYCRLNSGFYYIGFF